MKLLIIGCGQCGGRIADQFARLNARSRVQRGIEIVTGVYAVNTDVADLSELRYVRSDYGHRVLIGNNRTGGHGVGKINELGAEVAKEDADKVIDAIRNTPDFAETDAFLLISSAAGGTGSGAIPTLTQQIKERYVVKPVYNLIVLPFQHEELTEERTVYNTATCIKSSYLVADAVFLVDNQRYVRKNYTLKDNLSKINTSVVAPFYDLLCAGEEKKRENIGAKIMDAGDIIQTLVGWTVIGYGEVKVPRIKLSLGGRTHFRDKMTETNKGIQALQGAMSESSLKVAPADARRALYLVSGPPKELNMDMVRSLGSFTKAIATDAIIRTGDYPRKRDSVGVTLIMSELANVSRVMDYFSKTINYINVARRRIGGAEMEQRTLEDIFRDIPSLLS